MSLFNESEAGENTPTEPEFVEDQSLKNLDFRYKLSNPEFIFEDKCSPQNCYNLNLFTVASVLHEAMSTLELNEGTDGLRGPAHAFVPVGGMISPEFRRKEFMTYLQKTGFISSIAKLILNLYDCEGLPEDGEAIEYMAKSQGYGLTINLELPATLAYIDELKKEIAKYERDRDVMRQILDNCADSITEVEIVDPNNFPPLQRLEEEGESNPYVEDGRIQISGLTEPASLTQKETEDALGFISILEPPSNPLERSESTQELT